MNAVPITFGTPEASIVLVTPAMAQRWLMANHTNRNARPALVDRYARDMAAGKWGMTGEAIKFGTDGFLKDGQHRLMACVKAGAPFETFVIHGVPDDAMSLMDTGTARTASDMLTIKHEEYAAIVASAARLAIMVESGKIDDSRYAPTHAEIEAFLAANPDLRAAAAFASATARRTDCPPSIVAYTTLVLSRIHPAQARQFWIDAAEKAGLSAGDPVIALTNRFAEARRSRERLTKRMYLSAIYRAWNARRKGQPLRIVKLASPNGGLVPVVDPR